MEGKTVKMPMDKIAYTLLIGEAFAVYLAEGLPGSIERAGEDGEISISLVMTSGVAADLCEALAAGSRSIGFFPGSGLQGAAADKAEFGHTWGPKQP